MGKIITYTGPGHSGRTTVALNSAYLLAKEGYKTLVVDADQTKGNLAAHIGIEKKDVGLAEAATSLDEAILHRCFIKEKKTGITYLTLPADAKCNDLISLTQLQAEELYRRVRDEFDYTLVDCGNCIYEALSGVALLIGQMTFIALSPERKDSIWLKANRRIFDSLEISEPRYIVSNIYEMPGIPIEALLVGTEGSSSANAQYL
ncbi:MAG: AAA family ATPase, partial [Eubacteriales bacterium]|nr:AAA family ATPase [Eubacteriales bacterium]